MVKMRTIFPNPKELRRTLTQLKKLRREEDWRGHRVTGRFSQNEQNRNYRIAKELEPVADWELKSYSRWG